MRKLITILFICLLSKAEAQTANAGADVTIALSQTSSCTLDGSSSSATSYQWTEISTDYSSGATITSATSKTATLTGITKQGVFYFQLAATTGATTKRDSMKVIVNYFDAPRNSNLRLKLPFSSSSFAYMVNRRDDTTSYFSYQTGEEQYWDFKMPEDGTTYLRLERDRLNGMMLDSMRGKLYTTIEDGYGASISGTTGEYYSRSTITYGETYAFDTLRTYVIDFQAYFPQSVADKFEDVAPYWARVSVNGMHGNDDGSGSTTIDFGKDSMEMVSTTMTADPITGLTGVTLGNITDWTNKAHSVRIYVREGSQYADQKGFLKVLLDGNEVYYNNSLKIGKTLMEDYYKIGGLYDYRTWVTDPTNHTRNKKLSLAITNSDIWIVNGTPTVNAGSDQTISTSSLTLSGSATDEGVSGNGTISSYQWTKLSGGAATFSSSNSSTTSVTGLENGTYQFQLKATDNSGIDGFDTVSVIVSSDAVDPPTITLSGNQSITATSTTVFSTAAAADGHEITYLWSKASGGSATIVTPTAANTSITGLSTGTYVFRCTVTQDDSQTAYAEVTITVTVANVSPTANAGSDQTITLPTDSVALSGSGTDTDGTISSYLWSKVSGGSVTFTNANSASTHVTGLSAGTYVLRLTVTDNEGATGTDDITVTVNEAPTVIAPVVNTSDQRIYY